MTKPNSHAELATLITQHPALVVFNSLNPQAKILASVLSETYKEKADIYFTGIPVVAGVTANLTTIIEELVAEGGYYPRKEQETSTNPTTLLKASTVLVLLDCAMTYPHSKGLLDKYRFVTTLNRGRYTNTEAAIFTIDENKYIHEGYDQLSSSRPNYIDAYAYKTVNCKEEMNSFKLKYGLSLSECFEEFVEFALKGFYYDEVKGRYLYKTHKVVEVLGDPKWGDEVTVLIDIDTGDFILTSTSYLTDNLSEM